MPHAMRWKSTATEREISMASGYECFHCGKKSVYWDSDFDFEDYGLEGQGIVHVCHCANCGADTEYKVPLKNDDIDNE